MARPFRILGIGHPYCVALNRRLMSEIARVGSGEFEVTVVGPDRFPADFGWMSIERDPTESCALVPMPVHLGTRIHVMLYGAKLRELLKQGWDLVHCWEEPYILAAAQIAAWTPASTPLVYWTYQNISKRYPKPFDWIERYCIDHCTAWIAAGQSVAEALLSRGYGRRPHAILPPGVDLDLFHPDPDAGRRIRRELKWAADGPPVIGYLGRFVPQKGLRPFMEIMDGVPRPWRLMFIGGGPLEPELRAWAARYGDDVRIVTGVKHKDVPAYLHAMDLLCAPSQTTPRWREQFGRMLIEAFAAGVPVLASDSGEIPHVVADAGVIAGEHDRQAWIGNIRNLIADPGLRAELTRRGIERAKSFAFPVVAQQHIEFFRETIQRAGSLRAAA